MKRAETRLYRVSRITTINREQGIGLFTTVLKIYFFLIYKSRIVFELWAFFENCENHYSALNIEMLWLQIYLFYNSNFYYGTYVLKKFHQLTLINL